MSVFAAISEGLEQLKLKELNMYGCKSLDHVAALEIIIKMVTLTSLNLGGWPVTTLPEGQNRPKLPSHCF